MTFSSLFRFVMAQRLNQLRNSTLTSRLFRFSTKKISIFENIFRRTIGNVVVDFDVIATNTGKKVNKRRSDCDGNSTSTVSRAVRFDKENISSFSHQNFFVFSEAAIDDSPAVQIFENNVICTQNNRPQLFKFTNCFPAVSTNVNFLFKCFYEFN